MSKLIITLLPLFFFSAFNVAVAQNSSDSISEDRESMRVMTFNIRYDNPDDGPDGWQYRKDFVASMFRFHKADIVGTQEAQINQLQDMDERLPQFSRVGIGREAGEEQGEFCAIYYRTERFDLIETGTFWLSETPDEPGSVGWDALLPRIVTWARLYDKQNDEPFITFNTHFDHVGEEARYQSSMLILEKIAELANEDPVILMGDLNTIENQDPYKILAEADKGPVKFELFDGFYHSKYDHHGPTSTSNGFDEIVPDRRIDYIFVNSKLSVIQHGILADIRDGHYPSDHLPVVADVRFLD